MDGAWPGGGVGEGGWGSVVNGRPFDGKMSSRSVSFTGKNSLRAERRDTFLGSRFPAISRSGLQRLIEEGHIKVNGQRVKPTHHPRAGESIEVTFPEARAAQAQPEEIPLNVLFEDDGLLVLNKPAGRCAPPTPRN